MCHVSYADKDGWTKPWGPRMIVFQLIKKNPRRENISKKKSTKRASMAASSLSQIKTKVVDVCAAYNETDLETFMRMTFPPHWESLIPRILETGAIYEETSKFAPRWSPIPFTRRFGSAGKETSLKSIIFRVHDCLHQLWGLPIPKIGDDEKKNEKERISFKKMWMCAEMTVLTIIEFFYTQWLYDTQPYLREFLEKRNTLLFKHTTQLSNASMEETAIVLHQMLYEACDDIDKLSLWIRENEYAMIFYKDFSEMFRQDRKNIDCNWVLLMQQEDKKYLQNVPHQTYDKDLDGLQLTLWMIKHFNIMLGTGHDIDVGLMKYNQSRRQSVNLPDTWNDGIMPGEPSPYAGQQQ